MDEYDTPMQEAYVNGYWDEMIQFFRIMFNATFKTNPYLERGFMTGVSRISKESIFSDLNNLRVVTTTSEIYETSFGFTEEEVFAALDAFDMGDQKEKTKEWYNGFIFGAHTDIYNPWSIINLLKEKRFDTYWANTSSNSLISVVIQQGSTDVKRSIEDLLAGKSLLTLIDEQIIFNQLEYMDIAIWSLMLTKCISPNGKRVWKIRCRQHWTRYRINAMTGSSLQRDTPRRISGTMVLYFVAKRY